jgi:phage terminase large subunit-like protein
MRNRDLAERLGPVSDPTLAQNPRGAGPARWQVPGALWVRDRLDELRRSQAPELRRIVVAIDPSGTGGEEADECGIVAAGVDKDGTGWVLADASGRYQPTEWAKRNRRSSAIVVKGADLRSEDVYGPRRR